jgi:tRNA dimethylallyltransferase
MWRYLEGGCDRAEMERSAIAATRQLAKRQYTWLRTEPGCRWLWDDDAVLDAALRQIDGFLAAAAAPED